MKDNVINIEKFDFDGLEKEPMPYTVIPTSIIQSLIKHRDELALWIYLQSLPSDWKVNRNHICNELDISERTYHSYMKFLVNCNLVKYIRYRSSNGQLGQVSIRVLNGSKFTFSSTENHTAKICIVDSNHTAKKPQCGETTMVANCEHTNKTSITKERKKKQNKNKGEPPVPVFSDSCSVKTHIELIIENRGGYIEDDIIDQVVYYSYETNKKKDFDSIVKRINIALKAVRNNKWNTPHGYNGITSKSIRDADELQEKQKQEQYKQDAKAFQCLTQSINTGEGIKGFREMFAALKANA